MTQPVLTRDDVQKLLEFPSDEARTETAGKVCDAYAASALTEQERRIAEEVFQILVSDQSEVVRQSISEGLRNSETLPHDIALALARDVSDNVALPMLECSQVLSDEDLIEIIHASDTGRHLAIAARPHVSAGVSDELIEHGDRKAVVRLLENNGADIRDAGFDRAYGKYSGEPDFEAAVVARDRLPASVRGKIISALTGNVIDVLSGENAVSPSIVSDIIIQTHDRMLIELSDKSTEASVVEFVDSLNDRGHLTQDILLRALCQGDILFFEVAMSRRSGVSLKNARRLIHDAGGQGFKAIYLHAGLDHAYLPFFQEAFRLCKELVESGEDFETAEFRRKLIERFLTEEAVFINSLEKNDLEYLVGKL